MDGKVIRGTIDLEASDGLCLLAAYLPGEGITLAQIALDKEQNEISAAPLLLERVDLRNKVVIGDAIHTQREVSIQIGRAGGHYLWMGKGNQPQLQQYLRDWFDLEVKLIPGMGYLPKDFRSVTRTTKGHDRIERRTLTTSCQLNDFLDWPFLQQVFMLERNATICKTSKKRQEIVYGGTSLPLEDTGPEQLLDMLRSYWGIESGLHYRRDVSLHEDQTRFKKHSAAQAMAIINNLILGWLAESDFLFVPTARRYYAAHPDEALDLLL
jgi:predicted transposase YbfD/YdcC